jgi:hypothetical protein
MKKLLMAVIALMMTISASAQFYIYFSDGTVSKVDSISLIAPSFSVAADKQVNFSKGNLQYTQSTGTWSFSDNQWDCIGDANVVDGALSDKIDLFGWSASNTTAPFGVSTSNASVDYSGSFVDWGTNQIGTDAPNTWRTLSTDEWKYLFQGRANAETLFAFGSVNGMNGIIILPDNWVTPSGLTFVASTAKGLYLENDDYSNSNGDNYTHNTYTIDQWRKMESAGAVFLPATGGRDRLTLGRVGSYGLYWSSTENGTKYARILDFRPDYLSAWRYDYRVLGRAVRLVKDL